jgi:mRNA interferase MazF
MSQKDIAWIRIPFSNMDDGKFRPCLIISNGAYNKNSKDIIVCSITSKLEKDDYSIIIDNKNLERGNIPLKSRIRTDKILSVEKSLIMDSFAQINDDTFNEVVKKITKLIKND